MMSVAEGETDTVIRVDTESMTTGWQVDIANVFIGEIICSGCRRDSREFNFRAGGIAGARDQTGIECSLFEVEYARNVEETVRIEERRIDSRHFQVGLASGGIFISPGELAFTVLGDVLIARCTRNLHLSNATFETRLGRVGSDAPGWVDGGNRSNWERISELVRQRRCAGCRIIQLNCTLANWKLDAISTVVGDKRHIFGRDLRSRFYAGNDRIRSNHCVVVAEHNSIGVHLVNAVL